MASQHIAEALSDTPVVILQGPRQSGKSTLAKQLSDNYVTLDESWALDLAHNRPEQLLQNTDKTLIIDEVQRAPNLFRAIKAAIDKDRKPGRFLLTGSSNLLLLPKLSDSLAGRMEVITLWPLSASEQMQTQPDLAESLLNPTNKIPDITQTGYPEPLSRTTKQRQAKWFEAYLRAMIERDIRDLSRIENVTAFPKLLAAISQHSHSPLNVSTLSRDFRVPHTTLTRYLALLKATFLAVEVPAFAATEQAARSPKTILSDMGLAQSCGMRNWQEQVEAGLTLELIRQQPHAKTPYKVFHFRSLRRLNVPIVVEFEDGKLLAITVTDQPEAGKHDIEPLSFFQSLVGDRFSQGIVVTSGTHVVRLTNTVSAVPIKVNEES